MAMLAEAHIPSAPLKGPVLAQTIYDDLGRRLSSDIDLLVAPEHLQAAVGVVNGLGYAPLYEYLEEGGLPRLHFALVHERDELPPVELHWRIHWYERSFARERLLPATVDYTGVWRPAAVDELASLLLYYARDGFIDLRLATDLSGWWDARGADLPAGAFDELLGEYPSLARVLFVALVVADRVVGLPSTRISARLQAFGIRDRVALRMANPNPSSSSSQLYAEMGLIGGLLAPPGQFAACLRRELFPPRGVREVQARHSARPRPRPPLVRTTGILARYGVTMARLPRSPEVLSASR
jgi:hypothetical protein